MKKLKILKGWGIYILSEREKKQYGFNYAVIHPEYMDYPSINTPKDSDIEDLMDFESALSWVEHYDD